MIFILLGLGTAFYATFSLFTMNTILGTAMTITGLIATYLTAKMNYHIPASWTKSLLIFLAGLTFLFFNISTLSTLVLLIGLFFIFGTFNDLYLAYLTKKDATVYAWLANAMISVLFAYIVFAHRETIPADAIGLLVSIRIISNGLAVIFAGRTIYIRP